MRISEAQHRLECLKDDKQYKLMKLSEEHFDLSGYFTDQMLNHYKSGNYRISFFHLMKFLEFCKKDIVVFVKEFDNQLRKGE